MAPEAGKAKVMRRSRRIVSIQLTRLCTKPKGIFKKDMLPHYDLPEGFDFPSVKTNQSKPRRFHPATDGRYAKAWEYFESIRHSDSQLYTAFKLAAEFGLRKSEAATGQEELAAG